MRCVSKFSNALQRFAARRGVFTAAAVLSLSCRGAAVSADWLDFPASSRFVILDGAGSKVVGHARYDFRVVRPGSYILHGENRFLDGQYDIEEDEVVQGGPGELAVPVTYKHEYFNSDGSPQRVAEADFTTGNASCSVQVDGHLRVSGATLEFPADTYSGSTVLIPLTRSLREGSDRPIRFHNFKCIPGPRIVRIEAYPPSVARWTQYPGDLVQVHLKPEFGWLSLLVGPFVPKMDAWFDPSRRWSYVGGKASRYYKGPEIILVRVPDETG